MRQVTSCPAGCQETPVIAIAADAKALERFHRFSSLKYGGLLEEWLSEIALVVLRCPRCGHHWYRDQPSSGQLAAMYAAGRPLKGGEPSREPSAAMLGEMQRLRRAVGGTSHPRLLDFGSGYGRWARAAASAGFEVTAYEPAQTRGKETQAPFRLVHDLAELQNETFAAINVEQVLEHVPDPRETLTQLHRFCTESTLLRITVPNLLRAPEGRNMWHVWPFDGQTPHTMAPFEHLHGFTPDSLARLAYSSGFSRLAGSRILRHYPQEWLRNIAQHLSPALGSTFLLLSPAREER